MIAAADRYLADSAKIDVFLVIGTTAQVWPASGYVDSAIEKGARVAMVNIDRGDLVPGSGELGLTSNDWFFTGDAAEIVEIASDLSILVGTAISDGLAIYDIIQNPKNAIEDIVGILLGGLPLGKFGRESDSLGPLAAGRRSLSDDDANSIGAVFKGNSALVSKITKTCKK